MSKQKKNTTEGKNSPAESKPSQVKNDDSGFDVKHSSNRDAIIFFTVGVALLFSVFISNSEKLNHYLIPEFVYGDYSGTVDAYRKTGLHMQELIFADDPGPAYYTTVIATMLDMSGSRATQCFYFFIIWGSFLIGSTAAFKLLEQRLKKLILIMALFVSAYVAKKMGAHYSLASDLSIAILPWLIYFFNRSNKSDKISILFFLIAGFLFSTANFLRNMAGIQLLIFCISMLIFSYKKILRKELLTIFLCVSISYASTSAYYSHLIGQNRQHKNIPTSHPAGQPLYIGMGFLNNSYGIYPMDEASYQRAYFVKGQGVFSEPVYTRSENFDKLMLQEFKKLIFAPDLFFLKTMFSKIGIFLMYFIIFANAAIFSFSKENFKKPFMVALLIGVVFSSGYGMAFVPHPQYINNFFTLSVILGAFSLNLRDLKGNKKMTMISIAFILISASTILFMRKESALVPNKDPQALNYKL